MLTVGIDFKRTSVVYCTYELLENMAILNELHGELILWSVQQNPGSRKKHIERMLSEKIFKESMNYTLKGKFQHPLNKLIDIDTKSK